MKGALVKVKICVLFTQEVSGVYTSALSDTDELKMAGPKSFMGFRETGH